MARPRAMATGENVTKRISHSMKKRPTNPLQAGIQSFIKSRSHFKQPTSWPKRYTLYVPLLLLPVNFATHSADWAQIYSNLDSEELSELFGSIAGSFSDAGQHVTHIAINAPIALRNDSAGVKDNVIRSPSGLVPVWGDFGPESLLDDRSEHPTQEDFDAAFWISTNQDHGVSQSWAPRWTMFSHGNLSEKRRILASADADCRGIFAGKTASEINTMQVLDLYVGIGYFALCYLASGIARVWGWDLNPWSVEGLRRGCEANGWRCFVLRVDEHGECGETLLCELITQLHAEQASRVEERIRSVAFVGDNRWASKVLNRMEDLSCERGSRIPISVTRFDHINLGLLPTSAASWPNAAALVSAGGIMHVHENIKTSEIQAKTSLVERSMTQLLHKHRGRGQARIVHIEQVKTYAPGVMHCVLDVEVNVMT